MTAGSNLLTEKLRRQYCSSNPVLIDGSTTRRGPDPARSPPPVLPVTRQEIAA